MAKSKDKKKDAENGEADETKDESKIEVPTLDYDELVKRVCAIAKPLAGRKLTKRLYKTVKKGKRVFLRYAPIANLPVLLRLSTVVLVFRQPKFDFGDLTSIIKLPEGVI